MKYPFWIINSSLALLLLLLVGFIFWSQEHIPAREEIEADTPTQQITQQVSAINIAKIYENDLFGTYTKELAEPTAQAAEIPFPPQPEPEQITIPEKPKLVFLDPLDITLKGIVVLSHDDTKNRAIIQNKKTTREAVYKVGDTIEDAQLIRVFGNKVIFIRSNGQQEVLYLREKDAKQDPAYAIMMGWQSVVQKVGDNKFVVSPHEFKQRISNLAQFLDLLDATTAYRKGTSIGCRVGKQNSTSFGTAFGLQEGDIITAINGIPATTTDKRFEIYERISSLDIDDKISIEVTHKGRSTSITYVLEEFRHQVVQSTEKTETQSTATSVKEEETTRKEKIKTFNNRKKLAPTMNDLRLQEQRDMIERGRLRSANKKFKLTEQNYE